MPLTEIYLDVLIGLNICITWALFDCCELFCRVRAARGRKGLASLIGGLSSLLILLPEIGTAVLTLLRLLLAALLTFIAFGRMPPVRFFRTVFLFFLVNFLFAGTMIACWLTFAPAGMAIRNGVVYFHLSALTLILAAIAASLAARGLAFLFFRQRTETAVQVIRVGADGREAELKILPDSGNRLQSRGLPVMVCSVKALESILPPQIAAAVTDLSALAAAEGRWKRRLRTVLCQTAAGEKLLPAFLPDRIVRDDGKELRCLVALTTEGFGPADGAAPPELWQEIG